MGRRLRKWREKIKSRREKLKEGKEELKRALESDDPPPILKADVIMISGCEDAQTSADVSNVANFRLPDPAGRAGGACTSSLLNVLYKDEETPEEAYSFIEVLTRMRQILDKKGYEQIPQLTSTKELNLEHKFDLVPDGFEGTRRAVMIGINYVGHEQGQLSGCHNDVGNMKNYIQAVHGFPEENIQLLLDDGEHTQPTKDNMIAAYRKVVADSAPGDCIFLHYSGHGSKVKDDDWGEEEDGFDEVLVPLDYEEAGMIRDDDLYEILVKDLPEGVHVVSLMDCCHSGTILDLPYKFLPNGEFEGQMELDEDFDFKKFAGKLFDGPLGSLLSELFR